MRFVGVFSILILVVIVGAQEKYATKVNNIDLEEIFKNERLLNAYYKCLLEGTGCTNDGDELRKTLPDAIQTGCEKCTDEHKAATKKVAAFLMKEKAQWWEKLIKKYDPDNLYRMKFRSQLLAEGFDI